MFSPSQTIVGHILLLKMSCVSQRTSLICGMTTQIIKRAA